MMTIYNIYNDEKVGAGAANDRAGMDQKIQVRE